MGFEKGASRMEQVMEIVKRRDGRIQITLTNGRIFYLLNSAFRERSLQAGENIDEKEFAEWVMKKQYHSAMDKAVAMLAARARGKKEVRQKLEQIGYSEETVQMVIYRLEKHGYLNDQAFASQWTRYRSGRNYGPRRIASELRAKGISNEDMESSLTEITEEDQLESALIIARKILRKQKKNEDPGKISRQILSAVVRRGFSWDTAHLALNQALSEESKKPAS